jgi:hypothetical protein
MKLLKFNEPITFGANGNIKDYAVSGWSLHEDNPSFTWTNELEARVRFNAHATSAPLALRIAGIPYLGEGKISSQRVLVYLNGLYCGVFSAREGFDQTVPARGAWLEPRGNELVLVMPYAMSPDELGIGADKRRLGLCMREISLATA